MPKKLFLHIGRAKTGTTSLQFQLRLLRTRLTAEGIRYPTTGFKRVSQSLIALACHQNSTGSDQDLARLRDSFETETAPFERIIVSSEGFQNVTTRGRLDYFFRRDVPDFYDISVLCAVREFLAAAMSAYSQRVQITGMVSTPEQFALWFAKLNLPAFFDFWSAFGDRAIFIGYEAGIAANGSLLPRFAQEMGIDLSEARSPKWFSNPSISGNLLMFKLLVNSTVGHQDEFNLALLRLATQNPRYAGRFHVGEAMAARMRAADGGYNAALAARIGEPPFIGFSNAPPIFQEEHWMEDLDCFLSNSHFRHLREMPEFQRLPPASLIRSLNRE